MDNLLFNGWVPLIHIVVVGTCSYIALVLLLRAAGKRTLSRMSAYDMVITMALGSVLGRALLSQKVSISESMMATAVLVGLQYGISVAMYHSASVRRLLSPKPTVLFYQGTYITQAMRHERIDEEEIRNAIQERGIVDSDAVEAVILGSNGKLNVLLRPDHLHPELALGALPNSPSA